MGQHSLQALKITRLIHERGGTCTVRIAPGKLPSWDRIGVTDGPVANVLVTATGAAGDEARLRWERDPQTPLVVGGSNNRELTGIGFEDGRVSIR